MKLKSFNSILSLLIVFIIFTPLKSEEKIDLWKNKKNKKQTTEIKEQEKIIDSKSNITNLKKIYNSQTIKIEDRSLSEDNESKVIGIYEPADHNFTLNMWSSTKAEDLKTILKRLEKIKLSKTSNEILEKILLSFSYPPKNMKEKDFTNIKINWLIKNQRGDLIESFLKQNEEFNSKSRAVQYLVDENIALGGAN